MKSLYKYVGLIKRKKSKKIVPSGTNSKNTESSSRDDRDKYFGKSGKDDNQQNKNSKKGLANQSGDTRSGNGGIEFSTSLTTAIWIPIS